MNLRNLCRITDSNEPVKLTDALSSSQLREMVFAMGLDAQGKSVAQMEAMLAMGMFAKNHPGEEFPDQFDPMLAKDSSLADKSWIDKVYKAKDWIIEEKENGMRSIFKITADSDITMTSRSRSVADFMFVPHHTNVLGFKGITSPFKGKTVLDGELKSPVSVVDTGKTVTSSPLQAVVAMVHAETSKSLALQNKYGSLEYKAFDILFFDGDDVQDLPYEKRTLLMASAVAMLKESNPGMPIFQVEQRVNFESAYDVYEEFIKRGAEGIMLKKKSGKYKQGNRTSDLQKLKAYVTVDGFITGMVVSDETKSKADLIGGFRVSAYVDGVIQEIAAISNISDKVRSEATTIIDGKPTLNPEYLDLCVEMIGQEFGKNNRLQSARINEWRPDKEPADCQLTKEDVSPKDWK